MKYGNNKYEDIKIAYIGGGSRGWAWGFMSDLAVCEDMCGTVYLYDIDLEAAKKNEKIGNGIKDIEGCKSQWKYKDVETEKEALEGADFVVISILPGTFDEMESDVHTPEKYNIYQITAPCQRGILFLSDMKGTVRRLKRLLTISIQQLKVYVALLKTQVTQ